MKVKTKNAKVKLTTKQQTEIGENVQMISEKQKELKSLYSKKGQLADTLLHYYTIDAYKLFVQEIETAQTENDFRVQKMISQEILDGEYDIIDVAVFYDTNQVKLDIINKLQKALFSHQYDSKLDDKYRMNTMEVVDTIVEYISRVDAEYAVSKIDDSHHYGWFEYVQNERFTLFFMKSLMKDLLESSKEGRDPYLVKKR